MKAAVIVFPGSNCDRDVQVALRQAMGSEPEMVWHKDADFGQVDLMVLPGGFSYGDYLRSGAIAARSPVMKEVVRRAGSGRARFRDLQRISDSDREWPPARCFDAQ